MIAGLRCFLSLKDLPTRWYKDAVKACAESPSAGISALMTLSVSSAPGMVITDLNVLSPKPSPSSGAG